MRFFLAIGGVILIIAAMYLLAAPKPTQRMSPHDFDARVNAIYANKALTKDQAARKVSRLVATLPDYNGSAGGLGDMKRTAWIVALGLSGTALLLKALVKPSQPEIAVQLSDISQTKSEPVTTGLLVGEPSKEVKRTGSGLFGWGSRSKREPAHAGTPGGESTSSLIQTKPKVKQKPVKAREPKTSPLPAPGVNSVVTKNAYEATPATQEEVNAIPEYNRGASFFSGRPTSSDHLVEVCVRVGGRDREVYATTDEAQAIAHGKLLMVRAFTENNVTLPWYEFDRYVPYRDYVTLERLGWQDFNDSIIACFMRLENVDPRLHGYYDEDLTEDLVEREGPARRFDDLD